MKKNATGSTTTTIVDGREQLCQIVDAVTVPIVITDNTDKITSVNSLALQLFGFNENDIINQPLKTVLPNRFPQQSNTHPEKISDNPLSSETITEATGKRGDGSVFSAKVLTKPLTLAGETFTINTIQPISPEPFTESESKVGKPVSTDIETKGTEDSYYKRLFEEAPLAYHTLDKDGHILSVNKAWTDIVGYTLKEVVGKKFEKFLTEKSQKEYKRNFVIFLKTGKITETKYEIIKKDSSHLTISIDGRVGYDNQGNFSQCFCILQDISDRIRAEQALSESEEKYRAVLEKSPDNIFLMDVETGKILEANKSLQNMLGYTAEEMIQLTGYDFIAHSKSSIDENIREILKNKKSHLGERKYRRKDGSLVDVEVTVSIIDYHGRKVMSVISRDISARKQAEEERTTYFRYLKNMDMINHAIQSSTNLKQMMRDVLQTILSIYGCDRAWLLYPCDPNSPTLRVEMECTKPEWPGASIKNVDMPMTSGGAAICREALKSDEPFVYDPTLDRPMEEMAQQYLVQSQMATAIYPKIGKPWLLGIHQCSHKRKWTKQEQRLFKEIGNRVTESLSSLLFLRDLEESQSTLLEAQRIAQVGNWSHDLITGKRTWSDEMFNISGVKRQKVTSELVLSLVHPDDRERFQTSFKEAEKNHERLEIEFRVVRPDDTIRYIYNRVEFTYDEAGNPIKRSGTIQDITDRKLTERALRESEERFRQLSEAAEEGIIIHDKGIIVDVNDAFIRMLNYNRNELIGTTAEKLVTPESWEIITDHIAHNYDKPYEVIGIKKDGTTFHALLKGKPYEYLGKKLRVVAVKDITELKVIQQELQYKAAFENLITRISTQFINLKPRDLDNQIEQALQLIGEFAGVDRSYVFLFDPINETMSNTHEWSAPDVQSEKDNLQNMPVMQLPYFWKIIKDRQVFHVPNVSELSPEAVAEKEEFERENIKSLICVPMVAGDLLFGFLGFDSVKTKKYWSEDSITLLKIVGEIFVNAFQRIRAEQAIRESEERFRKVFEDSHIGMAMIDRNHRFVKANSSLCHMFGYTEEELKGMTFLDITHKDEIQTGKEQSEKIFSGEVSYYQAEKRYVKKDGQILWGSLTVSVMRDENGNVTYTIPMIVDITERKIAEEALSVAMDELRAERETLAEKNIALKQILEHIEAERQSYKHQLTRDVEEAISSIISQIRLTAGAKYEQELEALDITLKGILGKDFDEFSDRMAKLTPRELEVCEMIKEGLTSKQIADNLNLSLLTVHKHREQIRKKLEIMNKSINLSTYLKSH